MSERIWIYILFPGVPLLVLFLFHRQEKKRKEQQRSPFCRYRRPAGYSLQQALDAKWDQCQEVLFVVAFTAVLPAILYTLGQELWVCLLIGVIATPWPLIQAVKFWKPLHRLRLGLLGEQVTGAELDSLQSDDVRVFHDLEYQQSGYTRNFDHVVLTRFGLLLIETKARSQKRLPKGGKDYLLEYDGNRITFPQGISVERPIRETRQSARRLQEMAAAWTGGESVPVHPVLTYPGWSIQRNGKSDVSVVGHEHIHQLLTLRKPSIDSQIWHTLRSNLEQMAVVSIPINREITQDPPRNQPHHRFSPAPEKAPENPVIGTAKV